MSRKPPEFQPGLILFDALMGVFRATGRTFDGWCKENRLSPMYVRNAALGASQADGARKALEQAIDAAGRDIVMKVYRERVTEHVAQLQKGAA